MTELKTIVELYDDDNRRPEVMERAGEILKKGGLVAFPTETVYGLGGDALNPEASARIYAAKGRPSDNPLIVHIADMEALKVLASEVPEKARLLADRFWPGPLTMIMPKSDAVPYATTGGLDTVAIRMPSHPTAYELIRSSGVYIAAPSANTSGRPSPTTAQHVYEDLNGRIDMIIDSGKVDIGLESTIVDLTGEMPTILRPGYITKEMLEEAVGPVTIDKAILADHEDPNLRPKAPGMKYKHYAPKGDLVIVEGKKQAVAETINHLTKMDAEAGLKTAVIASDENLQNADTQIKLGPGMYKYIRNAIKEVETYYDFIIYDTQPHAGILLGNVLMSCQYVITPCTCDAFGIQGIMDFYETIKEYQEDNEELSILGLLIIKYKGRQSLTKDIEENLLPSYAKQMNTKVFNTRIRESVKCQEAQTMRKSIFDYAPNCTTAIDYNALIDEILKEVM